MKLKVLSWNIWIEAQTPEVEKFLKDADADIVGLQEVQADKPDRDTIGFMESLGYQHVFAPAEKTWGGKVWRDGSAIFSKFDIVKSKTHLLSEPEKRSAAQAEIRVGETILHVFNTHLIHTHQLPSELQEQQAENLLKLLPKDHVLVMGDFNATPESTTIKRMKSVLKDTDASSAPTWSVYPEGCVKCNLQQKIDTRLDYIFVSPDIKYHSFKVGESEASDHLPISVEIEI